MNKDTDGNPDNKDSSRENADNRYPEKSQKADSNRDQRGNSKGPKGNSKGGSRVQTYESSEIYLPLKLGKNVIQPTV